ncbi:unnamed protein product [Mortierella alpina]
MCWQMFCGESVREKTVALQQLLFVDRNLRAVSIGCHHIVCHHFFSFLFFRSHTHSTLRAQEAQMNAQPQTTAQARHLFGTAYIVYGPGVTPAEPNAESRLCSHSHSHQQSEQPTTQDHFWAIFRPSADTRLPSPISESSPSLSEAPPFFVLRGVPHHWGSYPPDIVKPHGCIPPHLYYRVAISEHNTSSSRTAHHHRGNDNGVSDTLRQISLDDKSSDDCLLGAHRPLQEWTLPFVHRLGDGHDHAGGLTTAYDLLQDLEDAEDYGEFINARVTQINSSELASSATRPPILPSLYACTEVLVSERRMKPILDQHFFDFGPKDQNSTAAPVALRELRQLVQDLRDSSENHRIWLAKSDLTLLLPL